MYRFQGHPCLDFRGRVLRYRLWLIKFWHCPLQLPDDLDFFYSQFEASSSTKPIENAIPIPLKETQKTAELQDQCPEVESSKRKKKGLKPKEYLIKICPFCPLKDKFLRQQIIKVHQWSGNPSAYLLNVQTTNIVKRKVFECAECLLRFTNPRRYKLHLLLHNLKISMKSPQKTPIASPDPSLTTWRTKEFCLTKVQKSSKLSWSTERKKWKCQYLHSALRWYWSFSLALKVSESRQNVGYIYEGICSQKN